MKVITLLVAIGAIIANTSTAQEDYQDYADGYEQDNLYQNYAEKQEKGEAGGGNGLGKAIAGFGISYLVGAKVHSTRVSKKMKTKHLKDQKALYTQYYNDVYKLEDQKAQQQAVIEQLQAALA